MKLIDIANRVDKSDKNRASVNIEELARELNVDLDWVEQDRIIAYWIGNWYCTDSYVGYIMYFFDDKPMAFSSQLGRKCDEGFHWFSLEIAEKVKEYLISLIVEENKIDVKICDINAEVQDNYIIEFNSQLLSSNRPMLNGEKVEIVKRIKNKDYGIDTALKVRLANGEEKQVDIQDLKFGYYLK
ncbi:hypothetical protein [Bacillus toyonensis]|uniref:hypothetical protein n=1 Tax=Bacillus toyonensis TaxID=155322 RepID=UPI0036CCCFA7